MTDLHSATLVTDLPRINAREQGDAIAYHFEGEDITFAEFDRRSDQVANGLIALGVKPGDRVATLAKNSAAFFEIMLGTMKAGAVIVPVNWKLAPPEVAWITDDCEAEVLFLGPEFIDMLARCRSDIPRLRHVIGIEQALEGNPAYPAWRDAQAATMPAAPPATVLDGILQLYTSGTTGRPKGVVLAHRALLRPDVDRTPGVRPEWMEWERSDVSLIAMPNFHISGAGYGIQSLSGGAKGVIMREFDPHSVLDVIEKFSISKLFLVPAAIQICVNHPRAREIDYSRLKYMGYGASPIPLELLRTAIDVFKCGFIQAYGMTETSGTISSLAPEDHDPAGNRRMRSVGKPLPGVEMKVFAPDGRTCGADEIGEIAIRASANMNEYWKRPDATAETVDKDGWLRTGDAGYKDADGYFYMHDRLKDMIISGGENVYPAEVENAIYGHPAVADVAVIGVPDAKWGEAVKAFIVLHEGAEADESSIIAWARERIAAFKSPKSVDFIAAMPRNPSGKILRRELRAPYWEGMDRQIA